MASCRRSSCEPHLHLRPGQIASSLIRCLGKTFGRHLFKRTDWIRRFDRVTLRQRIRTDIAPSRACAILICLGAHANLSACRRRCLFQQVLPGLRRGSTRSLCHPITPDPISSQFARKPYACAKENPPDQPNPPLTIRNSLAALGGSAGETF